MVKKSQKLVNVVCGGPLSRILVTLCKHSWTSLLHFMSSFKPFYFYFFLIFFSLFPARCEQSYNFKLKIKLYILFKGCSFRMYVVWKYLCSGWCIFCIAINLVLFPASWHPGLTMAGISNICPEIIKCFTTQYRRFSKFTKYHRESVGLQEFFHHHWKSDSNT